MEKNQLLLQTMTCTIKSEALINVLESNTYTTAFLTVKVAFFLT